MTDRLPQWVEAKVSRATSNISSVKHFLEEQAYLQQTGQSFDVPLSNVPLDLGGVDPRRGPRLRNGPIEGAHMTKQNLKHVGDYAIYLYDLVSPTDSMPQWVEHLVTTSLNDIAHVKHFLEYQAYLQREGQPSYLTLTGPAAALPAPQEPQT
jgi:hypothetical protein